MNYHIKASSISNKDAEIQIKESNIDFGTTSKTAEVYQILPNYFWVHLRLACLKMWNVFRK